MELNEVEAFAIEKYNEFMMYRRTFRSVLLHSTCSATSLSDLQFARRFKHVRIEQRLRRLEPQRCITMQRLD